MTEPERIARSSPPPRVRFAVYAVLICAAAFGGYQQVFSTWAPYDDEGYVMLGVAYYLGGLPLYEEIYTQYGPGLFVVEGGFHRLTGLPVTHDVVRLRTLGVWLTAALLCGAVVGRITRSAWMAAAAFAAGFLHLERLCLEPGHPQEICILATLAAIFLASYLPRARRAWIPLGIGLLAGLMLMTKLNLGVFLLAGLMLAIPAAVPATRLWRTAAIAATLPALALPIVLTSGQLHDPACRQFTAAMVAGVAGMMLLTWDLNRRRQRNVLSPAAAPWFLLGVSATCGVLAWTVVARGVSWEMLWFGLVGQHQGFSHGPIYQPAPIPAATWLLALLGFAAAVMAFRGGASAGRIGQAAVSLIILTAAGSYLWESNLPLVHGLNDRGGAGLLVACLTPLAWTALLPLLKNNGSALRTADFGRIALVGVAVVQPLGAFPVPGTQMAVGSLPLLLVGLVVAADLAEALTQHAPAIEGDRRAPAVTAPGLALVILLGASLLYRDAAIWRYRESLTPLNLPGAARLHVPAEVAQQQQWLTRRLRENADTFLFGEHALNSVYFWAELPPPTALNATVWPYMLRPEQQERVIASLQNHDRVCLVRDRAYPHPPPAETPLADYLAAHFRRHAAFGRMELWTRHSVSHSLRE